MATREQDPTNGTHSPKAGTPLPVSDGGAGRGRNNIAEMPDATPDSTGLTPRQQRILADGGFQHGGQNIHYLEKRLAERKEKSLSIV